MANPSGPVHELELVKELERIRTTLKRLSVTIDNGPPTEGADGIKQEIQSLHEEINGLFSEINGCPLESIPFLVVNLRYNFNQITSRTENLIRSLPQEVNRH